MTRNKYSRDFKIGAVKQVIEEKKILSKVSKELDRLHLIRQIR